MVLTRKQTNSLPPPRFSVKDVDDEEGEQREDVSAFEADVEVDKDEVQQFLLKLGWRLRKSDAKYVKKGQGRAYKRLLKIPVQKGRVADFLLEPKDRVHPKKALMEKFRKEKAYYRVIERHFSSAQFRIQVEGYSLQQELLQIESGGQTKKAQEVVEVKLDEPEPSIPTEDNTDGWVFDFGGGAAKAQKGIVEPGPDASEQTSQHVVDAFKRATATDWASGTGFANPGPSGGLGYLPDVDLSVPGPSKRYASEEEDDDDEEEEDDSDDEDESDEEEDDDEEDADEEMKSAAGVGDDEDDYDDEDD